jgi:anti-anti-sigma regulatory factor
MDDRVMPVRESPPVFFALIAPEEPIESLDAERLDTQLEQAVSAGSTRLLVDLRRAGRVGTGVLNALLRARGRLLPKGGSIALVASPGLRRFCGSSGLDRRFIVADNRLGAARQLGLIAASDLSERRARTIRAA